MGSGVQVSIKVQGHNYVNDVQRGDVITSDIPDYATEFFLGLIIVLNKPKGIKAGYIPTLFIHSAMVKVLYEQILWVEQKDGTKVYDPELITTGQKALVRFKPLEKILVERFDFI